MKPDWLVGIGVNVPLIDTSGRSDKVAAAHSAVSQVQFLKSQAKQDLTVLVQKPIWKQTKQLKRFKASTLACR